MSEQPEPDITERDFTGESWWLYFQQDRAGFSKVRGKRHDELARKWGSAPVSTIPSATEASFMNGSSKKVRAI
jgi:hypothetical protein